MDWCINRLYAPSLRWSLHNKPVVFSLSLLFACICSGLVTSGIAPLGFFPDMDGSEINSTLVFPDGTAANFAADGAVVLQKGVEEGKE